MKVICKPGPSEIEVASWHADKPEVVITFLRKQLDAAKAVWPEELSNFSIEEKPK